MNTSKQSCILLLGRDSYLNHLAVLFTEQLFCVVKKVFPEDADFCEKSLATLRPDYVFSFLNDRILRDDLLKLQAINFHPAPPEWPGRGSASLALFNGDKMYGATAHLMSKQVDSGSILQVKRFFIAQNESCESLFERGKQACLDLFYDILTHISLYGHLPKASNETWKRKPFTRKQFEDWLILNPEDKESFLQKIKAAKHPKFSGPFVIIHGHKFALMD